MQSEVLGISDIVLEDSEDDSIELEVSEDGQRSGKGLILDQLGISVSNTTVPWEARYLTLLESNGHQLSRNTCIGVEIKSENHKKIGTMSTMSVK